MPSIEELNPEDDNLCQNCEDNEAEEVVRVSVGGTPLGGVFVCTECKDELEEERDG